MGAPRATESLTVMNPFFHQNNRLTAALLCLLAALTSSCHREIALGKGHDLTEDLHHRLIARLWRPNQEPMIVGIYHDEKPVRHIPVRLTWERGTFSVWPADTGLVVFYMDEEATFSHVVVNCQKGNYVALQFRSFYGHPIR